MTQYHVTLNGQGYVLDLDRYQKRIREPFAARQSQGSLAYSDLRGPEQLLVISDWAGGEGYIQHDDDHPERWRQGAGLDVYTAPGSLRVGPRFALLSNGPFDIFSTMQTYGSRIYVGTSQPSIFYWDGSSFGASAAAPSTPSAMAVFLNRLYAGHAAHLAVQRFDGTTWTAAAFTLPAGAGVSALCTHYREAAQYLYVAGVGAGANGVARIYYWDGAVLSSGQFDPEEPTISAMVVLDERMYVFTADSARRVGGIYSVDNAGSGGNWAHHLTIAGNAFTAACLYDEAIYVGTSLDGEVYRWDGSTLELVKRFGTRATPYSAAIQGMCVWDGALWVSILDGAGGCGLARFDGRGWTKPLSGVTGTAPRSLCVFNGELFVSTQKTGQGQFGRALPGNYSGTATLESGLIDCGLSGISKLFKSVTLVTAALAASQAVQVEYRLEDTGSWVSLGTLSTVGATTATFSFAANITGRQISLRLTLTCTPGGSTTPIVHEVALRYVPRPSLAREWELAVVLEGTPELPLITLDNGPEPLTGAQLTSALWSAAGVTGPVTLVDLDGASYPVYVQDVREEMGKVSQRRGYQRLGLVRLVEAA
ncbi:MAG: hypothetical protein AB7K36_31665 [Chloroflexota bacterium]